MNRPIAPDVLAAQLDHGPAAWSFLSNHSHVLVCLYRDPEVRLRDIALQVGITERGVIRIVSELEAAGVVIRERRGRRNHYSIVSECRLRHQLENHASVGQLLALLGGEPSASSP